MINISNELKQKIINNEILTSGEIDNFFKYVTFKSEIITGYMKEINNYSRLSLCNEIFWSYNLESTLNNINNHYFCIVSINNTTYIYDYNYKCFGLENIMNNSYIEYKDNYQEYIRILEDSNE